MPMSADSSRRGLPVPELSHCYRSKSMNISVIEKFRSGAFAGASRRHQPLLLEDLKDGSLLAGSIMYDILFENPPLKIVGHTCAKLLQ